MNKTITCDLSKAGIEMFQNKLDEYIIWMNIKANELAKKIATLGEAEIEIRFGNVSELTDGWFQSDIEAIDMKHYKIRVSGEEVLFVEFGSGIKYSNPPHEEAGINGMGVGTFPGQIHAFSPSGWWIPQSSTSQHAGEHTYGLPPLAPVYGAMKQIEKDLVKIVQEVFKD